MSNDALREGSIDQADPTTKEEFTDFKNNLVKKLQSLSTKAYYNDFIEDFIKEVSIGCKYIELFYFSMIFINFLFLNKSFSGS